jgi:hypothetical protein
MKKAIIVDIISSLYALLFLYTGVNKLVSHDLFVASMQKSPILHPYAPFLAITVPALEIMIALALVAPMYMQLPRWRVRGLYSGTLLMALFTGYVWYILYTSPHNLPCSCGGIIQKMNWHQHLYFNTGFTLLGILACWLNSRLPKEETHKLAFS